MDPKRRLTVEKLLSHPWVIKDYNSPVEWHSRQPVHTHTQAMKCILNFSERCKWLIILFFCSSATLMWTVSLKWLLTWREQGRAPRHWFRRWVTVGLSHWTVRYSILDSWTGSLVYPVFCSGGMTRRQPPTFCCCQRSRGANLFVCAWNSPSVRTPALRCRSLQTQTLSLVLTATSFWRIFPHCTSY